jgi:hypothetical protein
MDPTGNIPIPSPSKATRNVGQIGRLFAGLALAMLAMMYLLRPG